MKRNKLKRFGESLRNTASETKNFIADNQKFQGEVREINELKEVARVAREVARAAEEVSAFWGQMAEVFKRSDLTIAEAGEVVNGVATAIKKALAECPHIADKPVKLIGDIWGESDRSREE